MINVPPRFVELTAHTTTTYQMAAYYIQVQQPGEFYHKFFAVGWLGIYKDIPLSMAATLRANFQNPRVPHHWMITRKINKPKTHCKLP